MTAPVATWWPATTTEAYEHDDASATCTLTLDGHTFTRTVEFAVDEDRHYGEDADGRRGAAARFVTIDRVTEQAPAMDSPLREAYDALMPGADSILNAWLLRA